MCASASSLTSLLAISPHYPATCCPDSLQFPILSVFADLLFLPDSHPYAVPLYSPESAGSSSESSQHACVCGTHHPITPQAQHLRAEGFHSGSHECVYPKRTSPCPRCFFKLLLFMPVFLSLTDLLLVFKIIFC